MKNEEEKSRQTVGQIVYNNYGKQEDSVDPIEIQREILKPEEYWKEVITCIENTKPLLPNKDFYVKHIVKKERILLKTYKHHWEPIRWCPTPDYDQTLFFYDHKEDRLDYLWTIPDKQTCIYFLMHAKDIHKSERDLLKFVLDFADGSLFKLAKERNGEGPDSPLLERKRIKF